MCKETAASFDDFLASLPSKVAARINGKRQEKCLEWIVGASPKVPRFFCQRPPCLRYRNLGLDTGRERWGRARPGRRRKDHARGDRGELEELHRDVEGEDEGLEGQEPRSSDGGGGGS